MKDNFTDLLCTSFYKYVTLKKSEADPVPGQLVSAHCVYPPDDPLIIKVHNYDAADPSRSRYEVKRFEPGDRSHFPIAEAQLRKDENYYIYLGKERPLVVVGAIRSRWSNPLKDQNLFLCAPLFTFKPKHKDDFKLRCIAFNYPNLFYIPSHADGCPEPCTARFELIQPIARKALHNYLRGSPSRPVALSDEAFALFVNHLARFLFKKDIDSVVCEQMDTYREMIAEELAKRSAGTT